MSRRNQLGEYFKDAAGELWILISHCEGPSVTFERPRDGARMSCGEGSLNDRAMVRMVPEKKA